MSGAEDTVIRVLHVERYSSKIVAIRALLARFADARLILEEADSVSAALQRLTRGGTNIVLLGSMPPDSDPLEGLETLRSRFPDTPVIMLTNFDNKQLAPIALNMGAKDCIIQDKIDGKLLGRIILRHTKEV